MGNGGTTLEKGWLKDIFHSHKIAEIDKSELEIMFAGCMF